MYRPVIRLATALLAAVMAVVLASTPAGAWSSSDGSYVVFGSSHNGGVIDVQVDGSGNIYTCGGLRGSVGGALKLRPKEGRRRLLAFTGADFTWMGGRKSFVVWNLINSPPALR